MLRDVLNKYEFLFGGTLGTCATKTVDIELQPGEKTYHAKPYPVPRAHESVLQKEVELLLQVGVFKSMNRSEWGGTHVHPTKKERNSKIIF